MQTWQGGWRSGRPMPAPACVVSPRKATAGGPAVPGGGSGTARARAPTGRPRCRLAAGTTTHAHLKQLASRHGKAERRRRFPRPSRAGGRPGELSSRPLASSAAHQTHRRPAAALPGGGLASGPFARVALGFLVSGRRKIAVEARGKCRQCRLSGSHDGFQDLRWRRSTVRRSALARGCWTQARCSCAVEVWMAFAC